MATNSTLLCIHRDPDQLSLLKEHGYELVTATNGSDGLRLFMSRAVDAVVLDYHLGLLDGSTIADEIKQVRPEIPIVMLTDHLELPDRALTSVDAEIYSPIGLRLKRESPMANTVLVTLANGRADSGYIPNDTAFGALTFQVLGSNLKPGCAETAIVSGLLDLIATTQK